LALETNFQACHPNKIQRRGGTLRIVREVIADSPLGQDHGRKLSEVLLSLFSGPMGVKRFARKTKALAEARAFENCGVGQAT
jgi:hypothetical protein